ncbi:MAG TPA: hypothetical protein DCZ97_07800 [Syntrophus sp. (in: bacteria)]|nr:hypothetical protein [Syntrophus sp. (in: bacteria)]
MKRPILFSGPMVLAILEGRKTQTRRIAKVTGDGCKPGFITPLGCHVPRRVEEHISYCPYGKVGDRLWVREAFHLCGTDINGKPHTEWIYRAGSYEEPGMECTVCKKPVRWKPSIHMPRYASRLTLEITDVSVERLQDISEEDAKAEGCAPGLTNVKKCHGWTPYVLGYSLLWNEINGPDAWRKNPYVWVVSFVAVK